MAVGGLRNPPRSRSRRGRRRGGDILEEETFHTSSDTKIFDAAFSMFEEAERSVEQSYDIRLEDEWFVEIGARKVLRASETE